MAGKTSGCSSSDLKILGDYWTLHIIQALSYHEKRFCELQRDLSFVSPTTLTSRLKKLTKLGLVNKKKETIDKLSVIYFLTEKGRGVLPILREIKKFAQKFL